MHLDRPRDRLGHAPAISVGFCPRLEVGSSPLARSRIHTCAVLGAIIHIDYLVVDPGQHAAGQGDNFAHR